MTALTNKRVEKNAIFLRWPVLTFFVLAFTIAWGTFILIALIANQSGTDAATLMGAAETMQFEGLIVSVPEWLLYLMTRLADFAFSIAGIIMIGLTAGKAGLVALWQRLTKWRISWKWYVAGLLPLVFFAAATVMAGVGDSANFSSGAIMTALFSLEAGFFVSLFLRGSMGEELGLRGFALPKLQERVSPFRASVTIGIFWAAWHLPVLIDRGLVTAVLFLIVAFSLSFTFTWLFNGSKGSLIPGLLFHATQNWEEGFETVFPALVGTEWELISTISVFILGIIAMVMVWRNGRQPEQITK